MNVEHQLHHVTSKCFSLSPHHHHLLDDATAQKPPLQATACRVGTGATPKWHKWQWPYKTRCQWNNETKTKWMQKGPKRCHWCLLGHRYVFSFFFLILFFLSLINLLGTLMMMMMGWQGGMKTLGWHKWTTGEDNDNDSSTLMQHGHEKEERDGGTMRTRMGWQQWQLGNNDADRMVGRVGLTRQTKKRPKRCLTMSLGLLVCFFLFLFHYFY